MLAERTHVLQDLNSKFPLTILLPVIDLDYLTLKHTWMTNIVIDISPI